jgi:NADPH-dependent methylglyoxal reductase
MGCLPALSPVNMSTTVFVSGANGFIAQHIVKQLIQKNYKVVGSVRSNEKGDQLVARFGDAFQYEIVSDIAKSDAFDEALKKHPEVTVFLHTASPFHFNATDVEKDLYVPAIEGTLNALKAVDKYGPQVKNVVVTSSFTALIDLSREADPTLTYTEESWNPTSREEGTQNAFLGYFVSKKLAEKAAWDYVEQTKPHYLFNTVNPPYVFGPQAFDADIKETLNTSSEVINLALKLKPDDEIPGQAGPFIDVRDVAKAHLVAFENKEAAHKRLVLASGRFVFQDVLDIIHKDFPEKAKAKQLPVGNPGSSKEVIANAAKLNFAETDRVLGFKYIDFETCVVDSVKQIFDAGL